jgi:hypothetical protein
VPFDGTPTSNGRLPKRNRRGAQSSLVLDRVEFFFQGGTLWTQYSATAGNGERCLVEAIRHVRRQIGSRSDRAMHYLARAIRQTCRDWRGVRESRDVVEGYNDTRGRTYPEIALVIGNAKKLAEVDALAYSSVRPSKRPRAFMQQPSFS